MARRAAVADENETLEDRLLEGFYLPNDRRPPRPAPARPRDEPTPSASEKARPTHYKIVCISLYTEDIERLEAMVAQLKKAGHTKANKSQLIRAALDQVDLAKVPKAH